MGFDNSKFPKEAIENFKKKQACFFVGAGLSIGAGFPSWTGLINKLIVEVENLPWYNKDKVAEYKQLANDQTKFLFLAEDLKSELGGKFNDLLGEWFGKPDAQPTKNHELLVSVPSDLVLTINYDRLIENAYSQVKGHFPRVYTYTQEDSRQAANLFWKQEFFILKAHGDASKNPLGLILSQKDYRKTLYREAGYRSLLQTIFTSKSIFFIGVSLNDPEFIQLMDFLHESYHGGGPEHYVLLEESNIPQTIIRRYLEDFKIHTITYKNDSGTHAEITECLEFIKASS
ncbi:MAG: hypothetical protein K0R26_1971 [Bacteroidota bacterium]|jgi:hypothetical protein|nr:hypothetical protein [Bacteroidota bacterium]